MPKKFVMEFEEDESDGAWSEEGLREALDRAEAAVNAEGFNVTKYPEEVAG